MNDMLRTSAVYFLDCLRKAWDAGDARAYAGLFTENASYVIFLGDALIGREEIERSHLDVFERWQKGSKMAIKPIAIHFPDADVCIALTVGGIGVNTPIAYDKIQTVTLVRIEDRWLCAAFHNTEMSDRSRIAFN